MLFNVVLERHPEVGLGLAIKGGHPDEWEGCGAHIVDILPGGPAFGKLRPGDVVIAINGISLEHKSYSEILATLRDVDNFATLLVFRRDEEPETGTSCQSLFLPETPADMKRECRDQPLQLNALSPRRTTSMPGFHEVDDPNIWAARRTHASFPALPCEGQHDPRGSFYCSPGGANASETSEQRRRRANLLKVNLAKKRASEALGVELSGQLIITSIASGGKAERSGLRVGDRVVNLNGIDAAHLSLIDAAYILRREQSDVTLMRVEHEDGEEALARLENMESSPRVYENLRERAQPICYHQHQPHTCCCHTHLVQGPQSVESVHPPTPVWQPRERPPASHICTMSPCLEESESEYRDIISRGLKLRAPDAVYCTQCHGGHPKVATWMGDRTDPGDFFVSQPGRFARLADEVDTGAAATGQFLPHGHTSDVRETAPAPAAVATTDSAEEGKNRVVTVTRHPLLGTGIRLIGGNAVGVFISDVNPQSSAAAVGVAPGDEILAINDEKVKDMTKADAALRILGTPVALKLELRRNTTKYISFLDERLGPGDDFYVRAAFSLSPLSEAVGYGAEEQVPALPITCGDIFHVTDSLYNGSFSSWLAQRVSPNTSRPGRIPSSEKALKLLRNPLQSLSAGPMDFNRDLRTKTSSFDLSRNAQTFAEAADTIPSNPYLRVVKMESFPLPRPIVLYGPLADRARQLLVETTTFEGTEDGSLGERLPFEIPPISGKPVEAGGWSEMSAGVIRMSAIQAIMERGIHPVVDLRPSSVEGLIQNGLPPIVLLFTASSAEQIKSILDKQQQQFTSQSSIASGRRGKSTKEKSRHLWAEALSLRQTIPHLITDCVPLLNSFQEGDLDETDWLNNLLSVIRYQQSQPIWVAEGSFVLRKQKTTVPVEQQVEPPVLQETDFNSSPKSDTGSLL